MKEDSLRKADHIHTWQHVEGVRREPVAAEGNSGIDIRLESIDRFDESLGRMLATVMPR